MRLTYRTVRVLTFIGEHPGASNREIAEGCGHRRPGSDLQAADAPRAPGAGRATPATARSGAPPTPGTSPSAAPRSSAPPAALSGPIEPSDAGRERRAPRIQMSTDPRETRSRPWRPACEPRGRSGGHRVLARPCCGDCWAWLAVPGGCSASRARTGIARGALGRPRGLARCGTRGSGRRAGTSQPRRCSRDLRRGSDAARAQLRRRPDAGGWVPAAVTRRAARALAAAAPCSLAAGAGARAAAPLRAPARRALPRRPRQRRGAGRDVRGAAQAPAAPLVAALAAGPAVAGARGHRTVERRALAGDRSARGWRSICPAGLERDGRGGAAQRLPELPRCALPRSRPGVAARRAAPEEARRASSSASSSLDRFEHEREPPMNRLMTRDGRVRRAGVRAARDDARAGALRALRQAPVQAPRGAPLARAPRAPGHARPLDGRGRRAARRPRGPAQAAVLRRPARRRAQPRRLRADRLRAARRGRREPARRARHRRAPRPARPLRAGASRAARAIRCPRCARGCSPRPSSPRSGSCPRSTTRPCRSRAAACRSRRRRRRSCARATGAARCATRSARSRSTPSCAGRTPRCPAPSSRASRATSSRPSPRTCAASAAR